MEDRVARALIKDEEQFIQSLKIFNNTSIVGTTGGSGGEGAGGPGVGGNFVKRTGDTMTGQLGFQPILRELVTDVLDLTKAAESFTGRVIVDGEAGDMNDQIRRILSEKIPGGRLSIQGVAHGGSHRLTLTPFGISFLNRPSRLLLPPVWVIYD